MHWSAMHSSGALGFGQVLKNRKETSPPHSFNTLQKTTVKPFGLLLQRERYQELMNKNTKSKRLKSIKVKPSNRKGKIATLRSQ